MAARGWIRSRTGEPKLHSGAEGPFQGTPNQTPIETLLQEAAYEMLETGDADFAGVWLLSSADEPHLEGEVVLAESGPIPERWRKLYTQVPAIHDLLQSDADEILI